LLAQCWRRIVGRDKSRWRLGVDMRKPIPMIVDCYLGELRHVPAVMNEEST
jgi:hypothetical protein